MNFMKTRLIFILFPSYVRVQNVCPRGSVTQGRVLPNTSPAEPKMLDEGDELASVPTRVSMRETTERVSRMSAAIRTDRTD